MDRSGKGKGRCPEVMGDANGFVRAKNCFCGIFTENRPSDIQAGITEAKNLGGGLLDLVKRLYGSVEAVSRNRRPEFEILLQVKLVGRLIIETDGRHAEHDRRQEENYA